MRDGTPTRRKIHQAALKLFVERGAEATTTKDLAVAAGVAEGTLYRHYVSKDALIADLFLSNYAAFARRLDAVQGQHADFQARLAAIVLDFCRFYDDDPNLFRFLWLVQHQALPRVEDDGDNPVEVLQRLIATAMDKGEIPWQPPGLATAMVLGLMLQPAVAVIFGRLQAPLSQHGQAIARACWRALQA